MNCSYKLKNESMPWWDLHYFYKPCKKIIFWLCSSTFAIFQCLQEWLISLAERGFLKMIKLYAFILWMRKIKGDNDLSKVTYLLIELELKPEFLILIWTSFHHTSLGDRLTPIFVLVSLLSTVLPYICPIKILFEELFFFEE